MSIKTKSHERSGNVVDTDVERVGSASFCRIRVGINSNQMMKLIYYSDTFDTGTEARLLATVKKRRLMRSQANIDLSPTDSNRRRQELGRWPGEREALYQHVRSFKPKNHSKSLLGPYECKIQERFCTGGHGSVTAAVVYSVIDPHKSKKRCQTKSLHRRTMKTRSYSTFNYVLSYAIDSKALSFLGIKIFNF